MNPTHLNITSCYHVIKVGQGQKIEKTTGTGVKGTDVADLKRKIGTGV
jgi:hypothetical protein